MAAVNMRRKYELYMTNDWSGTPHRPVFGDKPNFVGTPRQIVAELREFRRISGGCEIAAYAVDPKSGEQITAYAIQDAVQDSDLSVTCR